MDPYAVLGVTPDASEDEVATAYRAAAKRWHPDVSGSPHAEGQMALVNAAYDAIRSGEAIAAPEPAIPAAAAPRAARAGHWLAEPVRRALGRELLSALERSEPVRLVTPVSTWASPSALLAVTDRRLLWLLDDAVTHRVRSLRFRDVEAAEQRLQWPRRQKAAVKLTTAGGRKIAFTDLTPAAAAHVLHATRTKAP